MSALLTPSFRLGVARSCVLARVCEENGVISIRTPRLSTLGSRVAQGALWAGDYLSSRPVDSPVSMEPLNKEASAVISDLVRFPKGSE